MTENDGQGRRVAQLLAVALLVALAGCGSSPGEWQETFQEDEILEVNGEIENVEFGEDTQPDLFVTVGPNTTRVSLYEDDVLIDQYQVSGGETVRLPLSHDNPRVYEVVTHRNETQNGSARVQI